MIMSPGYLVDLSVCEWKINRSPALGMTEVISDDCYDNISISLNSKYVE